ncbi:hypothetical protein Kpol_1014p39 [Vanderwaltozyma polyspora DSM 70294]|uniref:Vid27 N-terminal domain-containing protein n=1 Tax=Vanderwaltozyma polyspora (strain ATCC 22028 / DSM 70294 / BCRC 21397 / CBS 2163 / NBRC 10782 / NRRL Y-8283 / UCD 57-17) TaxID=436907 RepID=A7TNG6_VANPO|nr:uncharacterized protein Kpol_1014p39 [Vanderwaltozyma polyspora DSM 70294]EDO16219.1 hypothetical protein Kpol_1014p39 [Vanderwaltozyma polyspora DSM 70294]
MNILRYFIGGESRQELVTIPMGQFDLLRSKDSPKSSLECIYNEAILTLVEVERFSYELVVNKLEEYIDDENIDDQEEFVDDAMSVLSVQSKKEKQWTFKLSETLGFHKKWSQNGDVELIWNNSFGDEFDEGVQYMVSSEVPASDIEQFVEMAYKCCFATKFRRNLNTITLDEINSIEESSLKYVTKGLEDKECLLNLVPDGQKQEDLTFDDSQIGNISEIYVDANQSSINSNV